MRFCLSSRSEIKLFCRLDWTQDSFPIFNCVDDVEGDDYVTRWMGDQNKDEKSTYINYFVCRTSKIENWTF